MSTSTVKTKKQRLSERAAHYCQTRQAHADEVREDYLELIAELIRSEGEARVVDLARALGVTHVTVVRTISRLKKAQLVHAEPYRSIFLTRKGKLMAERIHRRHTIVEQFLLSLGIKPDIAKIDTEGIEHHISDATLRAFERHLGKSG